MELLMQSQQLYIWYLKIAILSNLVAACSREAGTALSSSWKEISEEFLCRKPAAEGCGGVFALPVIEAHQAFHLLPCFLQSLILILGPQLPSQWTTTLQGIYSQPHHTVSASAGTCSLLFYVTRSWNTACLEQAVKVCRIS